MLDNIVVADLSIMLALMAGRNVKETTEVVQTGQVGVIDLERQLGEASP